MKRFCGLMVGLLILGTGFVFADMPCEKGTGQNREMKCEMGKKCKCVCGEEVRNIKCYLKSRQELNLTDEQVKLLEGIRTDYKKDAIQKEADIKVACLELKEIIKQDKPDFISARAKTKQIGDIQLASKLAMIDAMEKGFNTLTPEQQTKLPQLKKERKCPWKK